MIQDTQEYLQHWEKKNNPFYPKEMRWDRLQVNRFLKDYKKQLTLTSVGCSVWMVQDKSSLVVHGMFTTQSKAIKYANGSNNMAITNISLG